MVTSIIGGEDQSIVFTDLTNNTITNKITDENYIVSMAVGKFGIVSYLKRVLPLNHI